ncbi:MAG: hypothetical protein V3T84_05215 [Phycisphaerales bacterium]
MGPKSIAKTPLDLLEERFFDQDLLGCTYLKRLRQHYEDTLDGPFFNPHRSYPRLLIVLNRVREYDEEHARSFTKRLKSQAEDRRSCDAVFAEAIVYAWYVPLVAEGTLRSLDIWHDDYDLRIERADKTCYFLEIFSVMPELRANAAGVADVKTHLQTALSSIRQKLLYKVQKQQQMGKTRENWAVIELNCTTIAGDFAVLSSLSDGYKVSIDPQTMRVITEDYDWECSVFDEESTRRIRGIMWFDLGNYGQRRTLINKRFLKPPHTVEQTGARK